MSSALSQFVPVLTGANYPEWVSAMENYLRSQGQWFVIQRSRPGAAAAAPAAGATEEEETAATAAQPAETDDPATTAWDEANGRALGNIRLRLTHPIAYKHRKLATASELWEVLEETYGKPGISAIYSEFKAALELTVPSTAHPATMLDKFQAHFERLSQAKVQIPSFAQAMILLSKLPPSMDNIAQLMNAIDDVKELKVEIIRRQVILHWEQRNGRKGNTSNGANANKLSAIKRKQPDPPFQQQQQRQNGSSSAQNKGKGKHRGKRGGSRRNQNDNSDGNTHHQGHAHIVSVATLGDHVITDGPESAEDPRALLRRTVVQSDLDGNKYPVFTGALRLAKDLDIQPTFERIRALEDVVKATGNMAGDEDISDTDSHASKRARLSLESRIDWASDPDDTVSLGWTDNELDDELARVAGIDEQYRRVLDTHACNSDTNALSPAACRQLGSLFLDTPVVLSSRVNLCPSMPHTLCADCKRHGRAEHVDDPAPMWILDSGASMHFTGNMDDFIEYTPLDKVIPISTATNIAIVEGQGTVILNCPLETGGHSTVRIAPVYYIADLSSRLLSLGEFLHNNYTVRGNDRLISIHGKSGKPLLVFHPRCSREAI